MLIFGARLPLVVFALPSALEAREELKLKKCHNALRSILKTYLLNKNLY